MVRLLVLVASYGERWVPHLVKAIVPVPTVGQKWERELYGLIKEADDRNCLESDAGIPHFSACVKYGTVR